MAVRIVVSAQDALTRIGRLRRGVRPIALRIVGRILHRNILRTFDLQKTPWGGFWKALRIRQGIPLVNTGKLKRSIVMVANAQGVVISSALPYASVHQHGAIITPKNARGRLEFTEDGRFFSLRRAVIPSRAFMPITVKTNRVRIPRTWATEFTEAVDRELERIFNTG